MNYEGSMHLSKLEKVTDSNRDTLAVHFQTGRGPLICPTRKLRRKKFYKIGQRTPMPSPSSVASANSSSTRDQNNKPF